MGVDPGGAGDQGMMFGYACNETAELMPLPISLAHKLVRKLADVRRTDELDYLRPDGKSQVTIEYDGGKPVRVDAVVISTQHSDRVEQDQIKRDVIEHVVRPIIPSSMVDENTKYHINPTGRFVVGGPHGDTGLTGRKIIVDTYGGMGRHGGGAFSGKDPTKVDRSASYMARHIAKNIVAAELASHCEVQLAYAIGVADPVSVMVDTFGTGQVEEERLAEIVRGSFPLTPRRDYRLPRLEASHLQSHFCLRTFRPRGRRFHLGKHRQGRGFEIRGRRFGGQGLIPSRRQRERPAWTGGPAQVTPREPTSLR